MWHNLAQVLRYRGLIQSLVARELKALADSGVPVYFIRGNRDFLLGQDYARRAGMTVLTPFARMSGKKRVVSPDSGPREEKLATVLTVAVAAATASPLAVEELLDVEELLFPAAVTGTTSALSATASIACWLTSSGLGLDV